MGKSIGIVGGMGPLATADLYHKLVRLTDATCDKEHIRVYIDSDPEIPDRTAAILAGGEDPVPRMLSSAEKLVACGADCLIIPCNTAHYFLPRLQEQVPIPILSMPAAAARACRDQYPGKTVGVLATTGTLAAGTYDRALEAEGVPFVLPSERGRELLMDVIYHYVKAGRPLEEAAILMESVMIEMSEKAECFILGCTELPLVAEYLSRPYSLVDCTTELAKAAIRFCGRRVKGEE